MSSSSAPAVAQQQRFGRWTTGSLSKAASQAEYDRILATVPRRTGACTLHEFGYFYNDAGELRQIADPTKNFAWLGQKHYDYLGEAVVAEIYDIMQTRFGLEKVALPLGDDSRQNPPSTAAAPRVPIFCSPNLGSFETIVFIVQGSGAVRPGMWARALCINNDLGVGTIFDYIAEYQRRGFGVVVLNPNENNFSSLTLASASDQAAIAAARERAVAWKAQQQQQQAGGGAAAAADAGATAGAGDTDATTKASAAVNTEALADAGGDFWLATPDGEWKAHALQAAREAASVPNSGSPEAHGAYVFESLIEPLLAAGSLKTFHITAHSYGGFVTNHLIAAKYDALARCCASIAWTDACNDSFDRVAPRASDADKTKFRAFLRAKSRNYVASQEPVGTPMTAAAAGDEATAAETRYNEMSAGHRQHEWTSAACARHLFEWQQARHEAFQQSAQQE